MNTLHRSLILLLIVLLFALAFTSQSQAAEEEKSWWIEAQAVSGKHPSKVIVWYEKDLTDRLGFYALAEKESADGYTQAYAGPKFKFSDRLTMGVGIGRETVPNAVRRNVYYDANWRDFSSFGTFETGGSGRWHKVTVTYKLSDAYGVGFMSEKELGRGVRFECNFQNNVQAWGAILHDKDTGINTIVLGINKSF